ncbi:hypothetical protein R1sor_022082 [Riccia sorocarpa]|uniref:Killer toxin Kp4 domain-containing protein n=1 Tax=Riccia sorocarpa TaxID=122646 RepID=A0ABD3GKK2_9MARC
MDTTMQHRVLALLLSALLVLNAATRSDALGINCRGSSNCAAGRAHALSEINTKVQGLPDANVYPNGQHIACSDNICAFLQNISGTKTAAQIKGYVNQLLAHGCGKCGSVPTEPGNDVGTGQLTVNWIRLAGLRFRAPGQHAETVADSKRTPSGCGATVVMSPGEGEQSKASCH